MKYLIIFEEYVTDTDAFQLAQKKETYKRDSMRIFNQLKVGAYGNALSLFGSLGGEFDTKTRMIILQTLFDVGGFNYKKMSEFKSGLDDFKSVMHSGESFEYLDMEGKNEIKYFIQKKNNKITYIIYNNNNVLSSGNF